MEGNKNHPSEAGLEGDGCSAWCKAVGISCCPLGCLMVLHGRSQRIAMFVCTHGFSAYHQVVAVEKVGVGGAVLISFCLCLLVCERQREMGGETRDSEGFM